MSNEQHNLKNSINKAKKTPININEDTNEQFNIYQNQSAEPQFDVNYEENGTSEENHIIEEEKRDIHEKARRKQIEKPLKIFGVICIAVSIVPFIAMGGSKVDTSQSAKNALENKVSTALSAGTILLSKDENAQAKDYTITHKSEIKDTKIWVWDYAAEDGDYVQVIVNGAPVGEAFMIKHKAKEIIAPAVGEVQIKGIRDGGGGITYAIRYDVNGTSYFNGTPEGELNTYTLNKE